MDYHKELQNRNERASGIISQLAYERYQICKTQEEEEKRIGEIDQLMGEQEMIIKATTQAQKDFNTYLAIKESAVTLEQVKEGIEEAGKLE